MTKSTNQPSFPPLGPRLTPEEIAALPEPFRTMITDDEDKFRESIEESDRMIEEWIAEGCPTPSSPEEAVKMMHEYSSARSRVRSTDESRGRRRAS